MTATVRGAGRARYNATHSRHAQRTALPPKPPIADRPELADLRRPGSADWKVVAGAGKKTVKVAEAAEQASWSAQMQRKGSREKVYARRGEEILQIVWLNATFQYAESWHRTADEKVHKVRNVAEALRVIASSERSGDAPARPETQAAPEKPRAAKSAHKDEAPSAPVKRMKPIASGRLVRFDFDGSAEGSPDPLLRPATRRIPFASDAPAEEIIAAVSGKRLTWKNGLDGLYPITRVARVMPNSKTIAIAEDNNGRRTLTFPEYQGMIRTIDLAKLISVRT